MSNYKFKICMLGTFSVGKTSLVRQFVSSTFSEEYLTTVGVKVDKKTIQRAADTIDLILWDIEGPDKFSKLQASYLRGAAGYFVVADGTRPGTLDTALDIQQQIRDELKVDLPWTMVLNKADRVEDWLLPENPLEGRIDPDVPLFLTSAKSGENVEELFQDIAARLVGPVAEHRHAE